jgi:hypothetical protein
MSVLGTSQRGRLFGRADLGVALSEVAVSRRLRDLDAEHLVPSRTR